MTEPVGLQGPSPVVGVQAPAGTQPAAPGSLIAAATLGLAPTSLDDTLNSYELFVPGDVREAISQIEDPEQRLAAQREAIEFFSGETIYRYTAGGQPYAGKRITAQITLDNGQKVFLNVDQEIPRFNALYLLFRHGLTELSATAMVRQTNLVESLRKYLDWRKAEILENLQKVKDSSQENRDLLLADLRNKVRGLADQLLLDVSDLNLDTLEGVEAAVNRISQRLTDVTDADLIPVGAGVLAADSGASRDEIRSFLVLISQDRLRIGFKNFGDKLYQLDRESINIGSGASDQVGALNFQAYVWNEQPVEELSPFLKLISQMMFPNAQITDVEKLCQKLNTPSRKGALDRDMFMTRVEGALVGDIDGAPRPALQIYYHASNVPGESLDYVVASGDVLITQGIDGVMTTGTPDPRYEHINELLQLAGAPGTDFATRAIYFFNQHATEIYDVDNQIDQNTINIAQNSAFNAYLKSSISDRASTLSMVEQSLQFAQIEDPEERALLYVILAAIQMGKDPVLGNYQVTANGQEMTGISQESLQYIIDQVHQFYANGGEINGQHVNPLSGRKDIIIKGFQRFDRQAPALNAEYLALLVLAKHIAQNVQAGNVDLNQLSSAAGLSLYGTGNRVSPVGNRQVIIQELTFIRDQLSFQNDSVVGLLGDRYQEIEINARFLEVLQKVANDHSIQRNVPFYSILETSSLYRLAQTYDPRILDPLWILVQYIQVQVSEGKLDVPAEAVNQMESFLLGQATLSEANLQILLGALNVQVNGSDLQKALAVIAQNENFQLLTPVWQKLISGEWSLAVDQQADGDLILPEDPNAPSTALLPAAGVTTWRADANDVTALKDERIANLWLLVFDRSPESIPSEERALFTAAGVEIPAGISDQARQAFLSGLHRVPAYLSASALKGLVNILTERYIAYSPINYTGYSALKQLYDGQITVEGLNLTEEERALIRRILLMKSEEENVYNRILSGADRQAIMELCQAFTSTALSCSNPQALEDIRNALQIFAAQDNLVIINQPIEGLNELTNFAQKLESGYFTVNGQALQGVAELEVPEGVTHADEYQRYINILKAISDSLTAATYIEPEVDHSFLGGISAGMQASLMANDPAEWLSAIPQGMVRDFKVLMYFDSLQNLNSTQNTDISEGNNLIETRNSLLLHREDLLLRKSQGEDVDEWLTENAHDLQVVAEQFRELLGLDYNDQYSETDGVAGIIDRIPSISDPRNIGLYLAYLRIVSTGLSSLADVKEMQKEADFESGVLQYLSAHYNNDLTKLDEARQAYYQSDAYRQLDDRFQDAIRPLNQLRDTYEMEYNALTRYVNSDEIDDRFLNTFLALFAGDQQSDYGMFEWNYTPEAAASGTHVIFTDENNHELSNAQELYEFLTRVFNQVSGGHWTSISRLPSDTNVAVVKAKQIMAYILMNMPVNQVRVNTLNASMNVAASLLSHQAHKLHFAGSWVVSVITNPIFVGGVEWAAEELGVGSTTSVGPTSLETLKYYVNSSNGRHEYQIAQIAQGISLPDTSWRQNIGGMAGLIFGTGVDFDLGISGFDRASQIDADIVENAIESYLRIQQEIASNPANQVKLQALIDQGKVDFPLDDMTLNALQALMNYLRSHSDLHVNLFDPLNAASVLEGQPDVNGAVKLGLMRLAQLTLQISEIESAIYPQMLITSEDQQLNPLLGHAPGQILRRYLIQGEGDNREISIIRIDPADPNRKIIVKFRPATFGETFSGWLETVGEGFAAFADTVTQSEDAVEEIGNAFYTGLVEGANFRYMIPINIFSGFANDTIKAAKAYIGLMAKAEQTNDPYEKALYESMAEMMKKRFQESILHTYGSFVAFERDPRAILAQLIYFFTHGQLGRGIGYSLIALPFAMGILRGNLSYLGAWADLFRGRPVEYARWNQYGLASFPLGVSQKILFEISKRGWNNNLITRAIDSGLSSAGDYVSGTWAGSTGRFGLKVYQILFQNPAVRTVVNLFNIHLGGLSDMAQAEGNQGLLTQIKNLTRLTRIQFKQLKKMFLKEIRAYYEAQGLTGNELKQAVREAWLQFKQALTNPAIAQELQLQPLGANYQLSSLQSELSGAYQEIVNRAGVDLLLKKIFGNNVPAEYSWVSDNLYQLLSEAEAQEGRIRSAEHQGASSSQMDILKAQRAEIAGRLNDLIEQARQQIGTEALANKFERVLRNNLNRESFVLNADIKMKVTKMSAVRHEIKARLAEIRTRFFGDLVPSVQEMAQRFMGALEGPAGPTGSGPSGSPAPEPVAPVGGAAEPSAAPLMGTPQDILSGMFNGQLGEQFNDILPERLVEFRALLESKGVKIELKSENLGRLTETDLMSMRMALEALEATSGRTYRLILNENGYALVYKAEANLEVMVARGNFIVPPTGGGSGGGHPAFAPESGAVLPIGGNIQPNSASQGPTGQVEGNLALQPEPATELPPNPYDPISLQGIDVGRDGFSGLSTSVAEGFAQELVARKVSFITVAEGVNLTDADITKLLSKIPTGDPHGAQVPGLGRPTGRAIVVLGPDLVYSVSLYEGMTVEQSGETFRFMLNGEAISTYELRNGFEMVKLDAIDIALNSRIEVDINNQVEKITLKIGEAINSTWEEVLAKMKGEGGVEFLRSAKGRELVRYFGENAGMNAASLVVGAIQVLGFDYLADVLGIENPGLRMLFVIGNMQALTPVTQALLTGSFNLPTIANLAKQTFLTAAGWSGFYTMMGNMYVGGQIYSAVLDGLGLSGNVVLDNTLVNMGMAWAIPEAAGALTSALLTRFGASAAVRAVFTGLGTKVIPLVGWTSLALNGAFAALISYFDAGDIMAMATIVSQEYANRHPEFDSGIDPWDIAGVLSSTAETAIMSASIPPEEFDQLQREILEGYFIDSSNILNNITEHLTSASLVGVVENVQGIQDDLAQNGYWTDFAQDFVGDYTMARQALLAKIDDLFYVENSYSNGMDDDYDSTAEAPEIGEGIVLVANLFKMYELIKTNSNPGTYDLTAIERFLSFFNESGTVKDKSALANYMMDGISEDLEAIDSMRRAMRMQYLMFNPSEMSGYDETLGLVTAISAGYDPETGEPWTQYMINTQSAAYTNALESIKETSGENVQNRLIDFIGLALQNGGKVPAEVITDMDIMLDLVSADGTLNTDSIFYVDAIRAARGEERIAFRAVQLIQVQINKIFTAQMSGMPILDPGDYSQLDIDLGLLTADKKLQISNPLYAMAMEQLRAAWRADYDQMSAEEKIARRAMIRILYVKSAFSPLIEEMLKAYGDQSFISWAKQGSHTVQVLELEERLEEATGEGFSVYTSGADADELNPIAQNILINSILQEVISLGN